MQGKLFEVFHYQDYKLESVNLHYHDFFEVYFFLNGRVDFRVEGVDYSLQPGDLLLIKPQELHRNFILPDTSYERFVIWIDKSFFEMYRSEDMDLAACFHTTGSATPNLLRPRQTVRVLLERMVSQMDYEFHSDSPGGRIVARALLLQFMVELNRLSQQQMPTRIGGAEQDLISRVLSYIGDHFQEDISLESLAQEFFVSKYHLSHAFTGRMGTSVYRYITFRRLLLARDLLAAGQAPGEIYQICGFGDYANFYRAYRSEYGISPRQFANEIKSGKK